MKKFLTLALLFIGLVVVSCNTSKEATDVKVEEHTVSAPVENKITPVEKTVLPTTEEAQPIEESAIEENIEESPDEERIVPNN
ncbi:MAG: hypothetical protein V1872_00290 [bacterium]